MNVFILCLAAVSIRAAPLDAPYPPSVPVPHEVYGVPSVISENSFAKLPVESVDVEKPSVVVGGDAVVHQSTSVPQLPQFTGFPSVPALPLIPSHGESLSVSGISHVSGVSLLPSVHQLALINGVQSVSVLPVVPGSFHSSEIVAPISTVSNVHTVAALPEISQQSSVSIGSSISEIHHQIPFVSGVQSLHLPVAFQYGSAVHSSVPEFHLNNDIPAVPSVPSVPAVLPPSEVPEVHDTVEDGYHYTKGESEESIASDVSIQQEYGLPVEDEKPLIIPSPPALPELQAVPEISPVEHPSVPTISSVVENEVVEQTIVHSGDSALHSEYGLPVEQKPLVFSPAPALPELEPLPEVNVISPTTLKPAITSPHSVYGVPEVSNTPVPLGPYPPRSTIVSHYGEPIQVPLSFLS